MKDLHNRAVRSMDLEISGSRCNPFYTIRHLIGRLGSYHKAAKVLVAASLKLPRLFDNFKIDKRVSPNLCPLPQLTDNLTTLKGILTRMLSYGHSRLAQYQEALEFMDSKFGVYDRFLQILSKDTFRPRVHAELILLEFFHENHMSFVDNDRFIACSKPACYCCYHYINVHPGNFVLPSSHGVRYLNWRPPNPHVENLSDKKHQRDILNKMAEVIRRDALHQIEQRRGPGTWRSDSTTGISTSGRQQDSPLSI